MNITKRIKIIAVFSNVSVAKEFTWYAKHIDKRHFLVTAVFLNPFKPELVNDFEKYGIKTIFIRYLGKYSVPWAFLKIMFYLIYFRPKIVHAQLFDASLIALFAAKLLCIKHRIYTRHHGELHHIYHPHAVRYDRWINRWATTIICPSNGTKNILVEKENVPSEKIVVIKHGFDFSELIANQSDEMKKKYNLTTTPIIGIVSRLTEWKGIQYVIPAFKQLLKSYNEAILVIVGSEADYTTQIIQLLDDLPKQSYRLISFEREIYSLMSAFDIFIHVPTSPAAESFGQVYVEAFALAIPSIITLSGIAVEEDVFAKYSHVVEYNNTEQIFSAIQETLSNYNHYKKQAMEASTIIKTKFDFKHKIKALEALYFKTRKDE
ncbi:MAG: glycosyltransferase family 4 protein [Bacteroidales bacterium]|nr:glycosyltransferase family 4 protein [Bacteroidales bacterium]